MSIDLSHVEESLECPVCLEVPSNRQIFQCKRGHLICQNCYSRLVSRKCPVCSGVYVLMQDGQPQRSLMAAQLWDHFPKHCKFRKYGCDTEMALMHLSSHENGCIYRHHPCWGRGCHERVRRDQLLQHEAQCKFFNRWRSHHSLCQAASEGDLERLTAEMDWAQLHNTRCMDERMGFPYLDEVCSRTGLTPLLHAVCKGHEHCVRALLARGAEPDAHLCLTGKTPAMAAAERGHEKCLSALLRAGASTRAVFNEAPLHLAASRGRYGAVEILVVEGRADINARSYTHGKTPLDNAIKGGHEDVAEYLESMGGRRSDSYCVIL